MNILRLSSEVAALHKEQKLLLEVLQVQHHFRDSFQALLAQFVGVESDSRLEAAAHTSCCSIMRDACDVIKRFEAAQDFVTTSPSVFGWSEAVGAWTTTHPR
ncbi:hypothetical protein PR003_g6069 [Phytophthora rubi]|uniref:Uncharacterized protein n=1 Tax=Phytophthora rubi TaxID=129364 RepID=A0A6A3NKW1_9STRA|nr:hypothetical protein PR002_g6040 [Phytophthora rubi]KAE9042236.1 hypothetical protein PR001_g6281 [Phytophthora rubi]KAE9349094.1 hypothetical protein PR003_g6069 [Phytophthora rubi]